MKNINKIFLLFVIGLLALGCGDDFLTDASKPLDKPGGDGFYDSPTKIYGGVIGIYEKLYDVYQNEGMYQKYENKSDNGQQNQGGEDAINTFTLVASNAPAALWNGNFDIVSRSNIIIEAIESGFPDWANDAELSRYMGEARFMRALAYFNLVTLFGDVPQITQQPGNFEEAAEYSRINKENIFDQIIVPDLEFAAQHCLVKSELPEIGSAPKAAAKVLLAEAYLFRQRSADAEKILEEVVASSEYLLVSKFENVFGGNDNNEESIFEIQYNFAANGEPNEYVRMLPFDLRDATGMDITMDVSVPSMDLVMAMVGDNRYMTTLDSGIVDKNTGEFTHGTYWRKFHDETQTAFPITNDWNIPIFRYPDVLHLLAEAEINQGKIAEAFDHLNETRKRAEMPAYNPAGVSQDEALDMYLHERRMEFAGEMKRWRDLLRTGKAKSVIDNYLGESINETQLLYPIPQSEIDANPQGITQNEGY